MKEREREKKWQINPGIMGFASNQLQCPRGTLIKVSKAVECTG